MSKMKKEATSFFEKNKETITTDFVQNSHKSSYSTYTYLDEKSLNLEESKQIEVIFKNDSLNEKNSYILNELKAITSQIKGIQRQGVLLIGERIFRARAIINTLESPEHRFSAWINLTFKTKSSAYNALSYYEFYKSLLDDDMKKLFQSLPYKAAYVLASRKVTLKEKQDVLPYLKGLSNHQAMQFVNNCFPSSVSKLKKDTEKDFLFHFEKTIFYLRVLSKLCESNPHLRDLFRLKMKELKSFIKDLLI